MFEIYLPKAKEFKYRGKNISLTFFFQLFFNLIDHQISASVSQQSICFCKAIWPSPPPPSVLPSNVFGHQGLSLQAEYKIISNELLFLPDAPAGHSSYHRMPHPVLVTPQHYIWNRLTPPSIPHLLSLTSIPCFKRLSTIFEPSLMNSIYFQLFQEAYIFNISLHAHQI